MCIAIPLISCTLLVQGVSAWGMLREMDISMQRSIRNTDATLDTLLEEVCETLEQLVLSSGVVSLMQEQRNTPASYDYEYVDRINKLLNRFNIDMRENLYYSIDAYSTYSGQVISSLYGNGDYEWQEDQSLVTSFEEYRLQNPKEKVFAVSRKACYLSEERSVLTVYQILPVASGTGFVSISVETEKLLNYIVDHEMMDQGAYLILDRELRVILDSVYGLEGEMISLPEKSDVAACGTEMVMGRQMRLAWTDMDYFGWKCVQIIPMEEYQHMVSYLVRIMILVVLGGIAAGAVLSYGVTVRLFRPIEAILLLVEDPAAQRRHDGGGELQYLFHRILELFQKNLALEKEMIMRLRDLRSARAKALQEQMTPHFLNNVLQIINWIAVEETGRENGRTSQAIILLADILDTSNQQKYGLTTVAEEIEYTRKYVELICLRYGNVTNCCYEVDSEALGMVIPGISLQTLVENSIAHGFRDKKGQGNIYIRISVNRKGGLHICVEDDGVGMDTQIIESISRKIHQNYIGVGEHLGMVNFFQRFLLIYGEECEFHIGKSRYGGVSVEVDTPMLNPEWFQV